MTNNFKWSSLKKMKMKNNYSDPNRYGTSTHLLLPAIYTDRICYMFQLVYKVELFYSLFTFCFVFYVSFLLLLSDYPKAVYS